MSDDYRQNFVKKNYSELERISSPKHKNRKETEAAVTQRKLVDMRELNLKYGKLPLKPGFNKKRHEYNEKIDLSETDVYGSHSGMDPIRSRSIDPLAKYKAINRTELNIDKAADLIIEGSMNQYMYEVEQE